MVLQKKTAVVTGAGSGVGRAVSIGFAQAGYAVALVGRRREMLQETADEIQDRFADAWVAVEPTDVCNEQQVQELFARTFTRFGRIDLLFNNAGTGAPPVPIDELPLADWQRTIDVNLTGSFLCAREAFRYMRWQSPPGGRIINNGSVSSQVPRPFSSPYTASKHAVLGLSRCLALDGRQWNIACSQIDIGNVATAMTEQLAQGVLHASGRSLGRA